MKTHLMRKIIYEDYDIDKYLVLEYSRVVST